MTKIECCCCVYFWTPCNKQLQLKNIHCQTGSLSEVIKQQWTTLIWPNQSFILIFRGEYPNTRSELRLSISQYGLYFINLVFLFSDASVEGSGHKICICLPASWKARVERFGQRFNHLQKCHLCNSGQLFPSWSWWWWIDLRLLKIFEVQWRNMTFKDDNFRCRHHEYQKSLSEHYIIRLRINDFQIKSNDDL